MATDSGKGREALAARLRYEFDKSMSAGPIALIGWLAVISAALIAIRRIGSGAGLREGSGAY